MIERNGGGELSHIIVSDGEIDRENLSLLGLNEGWLKRALGKRAVKEVFLLTVTSDGKIYTLYKENNK